MSFSFKVAVALSNFEDYFGEAGDEICERLTSAEPGMCTFFAIVFVVSIVLLVH